MARNVVDRDLGLKAFKRELDRARTSEVVIGILEGANNKEGQSIAYYAAVQEYGASIDVAARSQQQYRSIRKNGTFNKKGRFVSKDKANFASWATIGAHTITIPSRPFMRESFDENIAKINGDIESLMKRVTSGQLSVRAALGILGERHQRRVRRKIGSNMAPANSKSTMRQKKSSRTLIDTGAMLNSVNYLVRGK